MNGTGPTPDFTCPFPLDMQRYGMLCAPAGPLNLVTIATQEIGLSEVRP